jgi:hypothetical protein
MSTVGPLGGNAGDPGAPTINAKKILMAGPLGADARDLAVPTNNAKKRQWWAPVR